MERQSRSAQAANTSTHDALQHSLGAASQTSPAPVAETACPDPGPTCLMPFLALGLIRLDAMPTEAECSICLNTGHQISAVKIKKCGHVFHKKCVLPWFQGQERNSNKCPNCRILLFFPCTSPGHLGRSRGRPAPVIDLTGELRSINQARSDRPQDRPRASPEPPAQPAASRSEPNANVQHGNQTVPPRVAGSPPHGHALRAEEPTQTQATPPRPRTQAPSAVQDVTGNTISDLVAVIREFGAEIDRLNTRHHRTVARFDERLANLDSSLTQIARANMAFETEQRRVQIDLDTSLHMLRSLQNHIEDQLSRQPRRETRPVPPPLDRVLSGRVMRDSTARARRGSQAPVASQREASVEVKRKP
ncbi:hypothetical protein OPT61_g5011 [Boeremia exigua]|uniref:Uncharacterized protein n=1 Tax=Boeremia exigua TaxID=749465 RepID=A0ACC2IBZ9_9PLEO|nr:hypothetical protein OPT61_g5011 [Boeremia exigua]